MCSTAVSWSAGPGARSRSRTPPTAQRSYLYANDGKTLITTFYDENRRDVTLREIAPVMQQAIVAAEDSRFYQHGGVDLRGVLRALVANGTSGDVEQGASTLTMQYVRNVLKNDPGLHRGSERAAATEHTPARKIQEIRYATRAGAEAVQGGDPRAATSTSPTSAPAPTASTRPASATSPSRRRS